MKWQNTWIPCPNKRSANTYHSSSRRYELRGKAGSTQEYVSYSMLKRYALSTGMDDVDNEKVIIVINFS
ncbi:unnamed protein product [Cochlearia groenlandica]